MRYSSQRVITVQAARIGLADESVYLRGSEPQSVGIDAPQTVARGTSLVIPARSSRTLELSPQGDWIVV